MWIMSESYFKTPLTIKEYWIRVFASWIIALVAVSALGYFTSLGSFLSIMIGGAEFVYWIIIQKKRLLDANRTYYYLLLNLLGIVGVIVIGCLPSDPSGINRQY